MGTRLFAGGLPFETTEDELHAMFTPFGQVASAKLITDKYTGRSKGFGFVEMGSEAEAQEAIKKLNGTTVGTRQITVNEARPMEDRAGGGKGGFGQSRNRNSGRKGFGGGRGGGRY